MCAEMDIQCLRNFVRRCNFNRDLGSALGQIIAGNGDTKAPINAFNMAR